MVGSQLLENISKGTSVGLGTANSDPKHHLYGLISALIGDS